jgi:hypothetical protein
MWNDLTSTSQTALDIVPPVGNPTWDLIVVYDTSLGQTLSKGCAAYYPVSRTLWIGDRALASGNLPAALAHEIGHYLGLADAASFPSSDTIMNQTVPGSCSFQAGQTTTVQASDAAQVTTCRAMTKQYAKNLAIAQVSHNPPPPNPPPPQTIQNYNGTSQTCTIWYSIVNFYVDGQYDSSQAFVDFVACN